MSGEDKKDPKDIEEKKSADAKKPAEGKKSTGGKKLTEGKKSEKKEKSGAKVSAGIDPKLAAKFKAKSEELKEKLYKEQLEDKIRQHTISPMKAVVPGVIGILLVLICIVFFSKKAETMMDGVNPATAPRIKAEGEHAAIPENSNLPADLKAVEKSYYTDTPKDPIYQGGFKAVQEQKKTVETFKLPLEIENSIGMQFRLIPPGKFIMGSPENEEFREESEYQHQVDIKFPMYVGKYEVTVEQWLKVMGHLPHNSKKDPKLPVTGISLNDALIFTQQLNRKLPKDAGYKHYVMSEEEWEYSCRAGTEKAYFFGHHILMNDYAVFKSSTTTGNFEPVGSKLPNPWGLYDTIGNAKEWTRTPYFLYACGPNQYAGINAETVAKTGHDILEFSWDLPVYDGEHPENLVDLYDKFDVPLRAFGINIDICYWDKNNNKKYDNHEPIWKDSLSAGKMGFYDPDVDVIILQFAKEIPAGTKGEKEGLYYHDKNLSTDWNPGEGIWARDDMDREFTHNYVYRGGSYEYREELLRSASRFQLQRQNAPTDAGVRVVIYLDKYTKN